MAALCAGPAAAADTATSDGETAPKATAAPAAVPPAANDGKLEIQPAPQGPAQPPNLSIPPAPPPPSQPGIESTTPPNERFEPHQEPPPAAWKADEPPRGEGAAAIPQQTPTGIKAIEDWLRSWFD